MKTYTVSFFGHRHIDNAAEVEKCAEGIIKDLIMKQEYVEFLIGRDGEFDILVSSAIRRIKRDIDNGSSALVLVLPYARAEYRNNEQFFLEYYDEVEICRESSEAHFKSAIQIRNRCMVDRSDLVVCCIERKTGGAYTTIRYAEKLSKHIINIADFL